MKGDSKKETPSNKFVLEEFQLEALKAIERESSIVVSAPTGTEFSSKKMRFLNVFYRSWKNGNCDDGDPTNTTKTENKT